MILIVEEADRLDKFLAKNLEAYSVTQGNPAVKIRERTIA